MVSAAHSPGLAVHNLPFALIAVKRHPFRFVFLLGISGCTSALSVILSPAQWVVNGLTSTATVIGDHDAKFWTTLVSNVKMEVGIYWVAFTAIPFFAVSLYLHRKHGETHERFIQRFMNHQLFAMFVLSGFIFYLLGQEYQTYLKMVFGKRHQ